MSRQNDFTSVVSQITFQIQETEEEFIYQRIMPYCETITQKILDKAELKRLLLLGIRSDKKGKWLVDDGFRKIYKCPECGQIVMTDDIEVYRFCHGCGMKMEGVKYEQTE